MFSKGFVVFSIVTGVVTTVATVASTVDQIINGDRRAAIIGKAAGKTVVDKMTKNVVDVNVTEAEKQPA